MEVAASCYGAMGIQDWGLEEACVPEIFSLYARSGALLTKKIGEQRKKEKKPMYVETFIQKWTHFPQKKPFFLCSLFGFCWMCLTFKQSSFLSLL